MATAALIGSFVRPGSSGSGGRLIVEQRPWPEGTGKVTRLAIIRSIAARLYDSEAPGIDCGVDAYGFATAAYVYPDPPELAYDCGLTHGLLRPVMRAEVIIRETVSFTLTTEAALKYPLRQLVSVAWLDEVWDGAGAVLDQPALSAAAGAVRSARPIYGSATVVYTTLRDTHPIQVYPRADAVAGNYESVFWANWAGGVKLLQIDPPDDAEEDYQLQTTCAGSSTLVIPADDPDQPPEPSRDREITLSYCEDFK